MQITKKQIFSFLFLLIFVLLVGVLGAGNTQTVSADESLIEGQTGFGDKQIGKAFGESGAPNDIRILIARMINVLLGFMGIIMVVLLAWAGYKWMTSQGNEETIREAKAQIRTAIIGLIIILMAYSITAYITQCVYEIVDGSMSTIICK